MSPLQVTSETCSLPALFSFQTREQLQADLLRCQAKIEDLEKLLVEKGQVSRKVMHSVILMVLSPWCPWGSSGVSGVPNVEKSL